MLHLEKHGSALDFILILLLVTFTLFMKLNLSVHTRKHKNISLPEQLEFWELTENGGSQWKVEDMPGDCGHDFCYEGVSKYFATSFE